VKIEKLDSFEREPISGAALTLLCDFASGDTKRTICRLDADWEEVFQALCRNGLIGLAYRHLNQWEDRDHPPSSFRESVYQAYRVSAIRMALMCRHIGRVLRMLNESGLEFMVVKGPALAHSVYPSPSLRSFNDLDLVVRERDWETAHATLLNMGFGLLTGSPYPPPKLVAQAVLYKSTYAHSETGLALDLHYDDILNSGLASRDAEGFWQRAAPLEIEGSQIKTLSLEDQLIHLCAHAHYHGYTRMNWFSDLAFLVRDHEEEMCWSRVIEIVSDEEVQVPVYYSLRFLQTLLDVAAPADVFAAIKPDRFRLWMHDLFLPEKEVLSMQPMWRPDFSFYFLPLFKRLIPDLLVMGRRWYKMRYLLRLLSPAGDWLRYYYGLDGTSSVAVHYLLHPLKLAYHYLTEIAAAARLGRIKLENHEWPGGRQSMVSEATGYPRRRASTGSRPNEG